MSLRLPILTDEVLNEAVGLLSQREPRFADVVVRCGRPSLRAMPPGLGSLLRIVTDQFLSLQAAQAIWHRVETRLSPFAPGHIRDCPDEDLMALGLSAAKARSFRAIAEVVHRTPDFLSCLTEKDDETARKALCTLPGVGPWTADIYLLAVLLRADAWPSGDLALRLAAADLLQLPERPDEKAMQALGRSFSPWRAVAARLLWSHYRGLKGLTQAS